MACRIYSLGYEKRSIEEFIAELTGAQVHILLDVREHPWSYKINFRKNNLHASLAKVGIEYIHIPEAGNPKAIRKKYVRPETVLRKYQSYLEKTRSGLKEISNIILQAGKEAKNICLMCYERDHLCCHRSLMIDALKKANVKNRVKHL